jgi:hypothetical protein
MSKERFELLLRPIVSEDADFRHIENHTSELIHRVNWKIPAEGRPNRRSRPIEIHLSRDTLDDYWDASRQVDCDEMDRQIVKYIKIKLESFDPHHDLSSFEQPQAEVWSITLEIASACH